MYPLSDESSSGESHESPFDKPSGQFSFFPFDVQPSKFFLSLSLAYMDHRNQFNQGPLVSFREALQYGRERKKTERQVHAMCSTVQVSCDCGDNLSGSDSLILIG